MEETLNLFETFSSAYEHSDIERINELTIYIQNNKTEELINTMISIASSQESEFRRTMAIVLLGLCIPFDPTPIYQIFSNEYKPYQEKQSIVVYYINFLFSQMIPYCANFFFILQEEDDKLIYIFEQFVSSNYRLRSAESTTINNILSLALQFIEAKINEDYDNDILTKLLLPIKLIIKIKDYLDIIEDETEFENIYLNLKSSFENIFFLIYQMEPNEQNLPLLSSISEFIYMYIDDEERSNDLFQIAINGINTLYNFVPLKKSSYLPSIIHSYDYIISQSCHYEELPDIIQNNLKEFLEKFILINLNHPAIFDEWIKDEELYFSDNLCEEGSFFNEYEEEFHDGQELLQSRVCVNNVLRYYCDTDFVIDVYKTILQNYTQIQSLILFSYLEFCSQYTLDAGYILWDEETTIFLLPHLFRNAIKYHNTEEIIQNIQTWLNVLVASENHVHNLIALNILNEYRFFEPHLYLELSIKIINDIIPHLTRGFGQEMLNCANPLFEFIQPELLIPDFFVKAFSLFEATHNNRIDFYTLAELSSIISSQMKRVDLDQELCLYAWEIFKHLVIENPELSMNFGRDVLFNLPYSDFEDIEPTFNLFLQNTGKLLYNDSEYIYFGCLSFFAKHGFINRYLELVNEYQPILELGYVLPLIFMEEIDIELKTILFNKIINGSQQNPMYIDNSIMKFIILGAIIYLIDADLLISFLPSHNINTFINFVFKNLKIIMGKTMFMMETKIIICFLVSLLKTYPKHIIPVIYYYLYEFIPRISTNLNGNSLSTNIIIDSTFCQKQFEFLNVSNLDFIMYIYKSLPPESITTEFSQFFRDKIGLIP